MSAQEELFMPGDKVAHIENGREMTVFETNDNGVRCFWQEDGPEGGGRKEAYFKAGELRMVEEAK